VSFACALCAPFLASDLLPSSFDILLVRSQSNQHHHRYNQQVQRFVKGASGTGRDLNDDDDDEDEEAQLQRDADNHDKDLTLTELVAKATEVAQEAAKNSAISGGGGDASGKTVPFFRGEKV